MTIPEARPIKGWWFGGDILPNGDGRTVTEGCVLSVEPPIILCECGLHFSPRILDALEYAMGATVWRVEGWGEVEEVSDKIACEHRRHIWRLDICAALRRFACHEALRVLPADAPACVREYLAMADKASEEQIAKALYAVCDAAWDATRYAAVRVAWDAARCAAWYAAKSVSGDRAWYAARTRQARSLEAMVWAERRRTLAEAVEDGR